MSTSASEIPLAVVGCDFRVASSRWRSRLVLEPEDAIAIAAALGRTETGDGFADVNTCNRNEWIVSSHDPLWVGELLRTQMKQRSAEWLEPYVLVGEAAARHIFRVALGRESLIVGERQIAGQVFRALETSRSRGTSSRVLNGLSSIAGRLVRIAQRRGCLGSYSRGVHSLAIHYLEDVLPRTEKPYRVLVIGMGEIGRRVLSLLDAWEAFEPIPCNRTVTQPPGRVRPFAELPSLLCEVDAAIVCTSAMEPIITGAALQKTERLRLIVDIGIPEQVERTGLPPAVAVAGLDELTAFQSGVSPEADGHDDDVEALVQRAVTEFRVFCGEQPFSEILDTVQRHHRLIVGEEIPNVIAERFAAFPEDTRTEIEETLKSIVLEYTNEVFRTIKESTKRFTDGGGEG